MIRRATGGLYCEVRIGENKICGVQGYAGKDIVPYWVGPGKTEWRCASCAAKKLGALKKNGTSQYNARKRKDPPSVRDGSDYARADNPELLSPQPGKQAVTEQGATTSVRPVTTAGNHQRKAGDEQPDQGGLFD